MSSMYSLSVDLASIQPSFTNSVANAYGIFSTHESQVAADGGGGKESMWAIGLNFVLVRKVWKSNSKKRVIL